ncbi:unnamed protein product [Schistosoma curassoni]|uniref:CASPASE_P20 domain-containing protein n=1 Tax=Schistosoma curassoni TaxID=6186 RepID=A0A183JS56_9TREM|nr:unnamed protein product [Schistosoma curassoni]
MVAADQRLVHTPFVPSGYWSPCTPVVWDPVKAPDLRSSSSHFRKQHPRHEKAVISTQNLRDHDCFACVILSHGDEGGLIYATDGSIPVDRIIAPFRGDQCLDLRGKPKLFFIQVCPF